MKFYLLIILLTIPCSSGLYNIYESEHARQVQTGMATILNSGNNHLIRQAAVQKYSGGFYAIIFENGGGIIIKESGISPARRETEQAVLRRKR